jgi:hypothetical protein
VAGIFVVGAGGWTIAWQSGLWKPTPLRDGGSTQMAAGAQVLGYFSAVCYLGYVFLLELTPQLLITLFTGPAYLRSTRITKKSLAKVFPCCFSSFLCWEISLME